ncbi:collagen-like protein [Flagellimonas allohymeniacidonis]|uniref:Collagen-like protein n=1 Tax=Flagellimonas allohymeniacidonis TaxID=2517819 RepID=A0A4Q8QDM2_9FLAO|nr:collagen-like protein [Allomuricauda hymeniacidonis]TAI47208.1 collagen-like protein [Allomuricauda hymeniacidonis]
MKLSKVLALLCMALTATLFSCSGEDGERGVAGSDGAPGTPGQPGAAGVNCWDLNGNGQEDEDEDLNKDGEFNALDCQGADGDDGQPGDPGADGNAEVYTVTFKGIANGFNSYSQDMNELDGIVENFSEWAFLGYVSKGSQLFPVPGAIEKGPNTDTFFYTLFFVTDSEDPKLGPRATLNHYELDFQSGYNPTSDDVDDFIVVAIKSNVVNSSKSAQVGIEAELKAAGVDTSDYYAVMDYFGL